MIKVREINRNELMRGYDISLFIGDIVLYKLFREGNKMDYYALDKEKRWLNDDSPYVIGGRDTDISQIAWGLEYKIKELFPINKVPDNLVERINVLKSICKDCEDLIQEVISLVSDYQK